HFVMASPLGSRVSPTLSCRRVGAAGVRTASSHAGGRRPPPRTLRVCASSPVGPVSPSLFPTLDRDSDIEPSPSHRSARPTRRNRGAWARSSRRLLTLHRTGPPAAAGEFKIVRRFGPFMRAVLTLLAAGVLLAQGASAAGPFRVLQGAYAQVGKTLVYDGESGNHSWFARLMTGRP